MNSNQNMLRGILVPLICVVVVLVLGLVIPFVTTGTFVVSLLFGIVAIGVAAGSVVLANKNGGGAKSRFYGFPISRLGINYSIIQLVLSLIFMILAGFIPAWIAIAVDVILLAAACIGLIATDMTRDEIVRQDQEQHRTTADMVALRSRANALTGLTDDAATAEQLRKLAEQFRFSDPVSCPATGELEANLYALLDELRQAVVTGNPERVSSLCRRTEAELAERNRICKLNK